MHLYTITELFNAFNLVHIGHDVCMQTRLVAEYDAFIRSDNIGIYIIFKHIEAARSTGSSGSCSKGCRPETAYHLQVVGDTRHVWSLEWPAGHTSMVKHRFFVHHRSLYSHWPRPVTLGRRGHHPCNPKSKLNPLCVVSVDSVPETCLW